MPNTTRTDNPKLRQLIAEQERDQQSYHIFPERINPRRQLLFPVLTPRVKICFILSLFMKRTDIAAGLNMKSDTISKYRKRALNLLSKDDVKKYRKISLGS